MSGVIEALHIYDERNTPILSHTYTSRPLSAAHLLPLYLEHPTPRPNLIYLSTTNPPTLVFSLVHANLLFLLTTSSEVEPLLVLEFLHRVVDALEECLGAPLLPSKIENSYDVAAQLLTELCDAGTVATTEPNALRDLVEVEGFMGKLLGSITLPGSTSRPGGPSPFGSSGSGSNTPSLLSAQNAPALPWRRANVRHTSNEMYADVVETLSVTLAPSGRPIAAFAYGTIAFTSKVSGVPDVVLSLTSPSGRHNLKNIMELPVFHPCVRLARWKERPGELSFVPPDGRFILAGYEVDLLPFDSGKSGSLTANNLQLPVNIEMKTGLGPAGSDFEARVHISRTFTSSLTTGTGGSGGGLGGGAGGMSGRGFGSGPHPGTLGAPLLEDVRIMIPLPAEVRNLSEIRPSKGDATYNPGDQFLEWHISNKDLAAGTTYFGLRCTVVGQQSATDEDAAAGGDPMGFGGAGFREYEPYQADEKDDSGAGDDDKAAKEKKTSAPEKLAQQNRMLMPSSASVSFGVKGWLPSGIKIESIVLDTKRSRGLGEGVKPYKGVKYLTISKGGVEVRC